MIIIDKEKEKQHFRKHILPKYQDRAFTNDDLELKRIAALHTKRGLATLLGLDVSNSEISNIKKDNLAYQYLIQKRTLSS